MIKHQLFIFVIDDNPFDLDFISTTIKENTDLVKISTAENGSEALEKLELMYQTKSLPDLIISDINMHKINGLELYSNLKNDVRFNKINMKLLTTSSFSQKLYSEKKIPIYKKHFNLVEYESIILNMLLDVGRKKSKKSI